MPIALVIIDIQAQHIMYTGVLLLKVKCITGSVQHKVYATSMPDRILQSLTHHDDHVLASVSWDRSPRRLRPMQKSTRNPLSESLSGPRSSHRGAGSELYNAGYASAIVAKTDANQVEWNHPQRDFHLGCRATETGRRAGPGTTGSRILHAKEVHAGYLGAAGQPRPRKA